MIDKLTQNLFSKKGFLRMLCTKSKLKYQRPVLGADRGVSCNSKDSDVIFHQNDIHYPIIYVPDNFIVFMTIFATLSARSIDAPDVAFK